MHSRRCFVALLLLSLCIIAFQQDGRPAEVWKRYYAHDAVHDKYGVIAPWYTGQNGAFDQRIRIAGETIKRYPWVSKENAAGAAPEYAYNNTWRITPEGVISIPALNDYTYGGRGQACARVIGGLTEYYRYTGDPAALAHLQLVVDSLLDSCQTPANHPWPRFLISVPVAGKPYYQASPEGWIQLDIVAEAGVSILRAYELTGNARWFEAVKHWADLFVQKRNREKGAAPWLRYANPEKVKWGMTREGNVQTAGVIYQLAMLDELIRLGYTGVGNSILEARDAAREYFKGVLLPAWLSNDTWGRNYWDWEDPVQSQTTTDWVARYIMTNKKSFPNWKNDVRNILGIYLNHTSVNPASHGDVYSGAWALPESLGCCESSLSWAPMELANGFARYGVEAGSEWALEIARRMQILSSYEFLETGVVEDKIEGGTIAAGGWFNGTHPSALEWILQHMAWQPELLGAARENHIMRSSAVVNAVSYGKGKVAYSTFDAPRDTVDVLRLSFDPKSVTADGKALPRRADLKEIGYTVKALPVGDVIVSIRHDGLKQVTVEGADPQVVLSSKQLQFSGKWTGMPRPGLRTSSEAGAAMSCTFEGNQVRLIGSVGPQGGVADVYIDDVKQLTIVDFWNPKPLDGQVVYYKNGMPNGRHTFRLALRGDKNLVSQGKSAYVESVQFSAATGNNGSGSGGGPTDAQRMIFGYPSRKDYVDINGYSWRPAFEVVARTGQITDSVAETWWTMKQAVFIEGTDDRELYQYGVHATDFTANLTLGPGKYHVRLKFAETRFKDPNKRAVSIFINDEKLVERMDILATAGKTNKAVDLVFNNIEPRNGIIEIRFVGEKVGGCGTEAIVQALEVGTGDGGTGATPKMADLK